MDNPQEMLLAAAVDGRVKTIRLLLAAGVDVHHDNDNALYLAARHGHDEVVRCLLAANANIHARGDAALRTAILNDHKKVIRILLDAGADPMASWLATDRRSRVVVASQLIVHAAAMTPEQRKALARRSRLLRDLCPTQSVTRPGP